MSANLSNAEILNNLLEGRNLDELTSKSLMQRWLNDEISDVETGAFLSALSCLLYTSPSPRDQSGSRMPSSA